MDWEVLGNIHGREEVWPGLPRGLVSSGRMEGAATWKNSDGVIEEVIEEVKEGATRNDEAESKGTQQGPEEGPGSLLIGDMGHEGLKDVLGVAVKAGTAEDGSSSSLQLVAVNGEGA